MVNIKKNTHKGQFYFKFIILSASGDMFIELKNLNFGYFVPQNYTIFFNFILKDNNFFGIDAYLLKNY